MRDLVFRDKRHGWRYPTIRIELEGGRTVCESNTDNAFSRGFATNLFLRESCHQCPIKARGMAGDIVLGDFWELARHRPESVNPQGTSAVIAVTDKGLAAVNAGRDRMELAEYPFEYLSDSSMLRRCATPRADRAAFFADLDRLSFPELAARHLRQRNALVRYAASARRFLRALAGRLKG